MLTMNWAENKPPSIFGAMAGKAMPSAVARLANVSKPYFRRIMITEQCAQPSGQVLF